MNVEIPAAINRLRAVLKTAYTPGMRTIVRAYTLASDPHAGTWRVLIDTQVDLNDDGNTVGATEPDETEDGHAWHTVYSRALTGFWERGRAIDAYQAVVGDLIQTHRLVERREWAAETGAAEPEPEHAAREVAEVATMVHSAASGHLIPMEPGQLVTDIDNNLWCVLELPEGRCEHLSERDAQGRRLGLLPITIDAQSNTASVRGACMSPSAAHAEAAGPGRTTGGLWFDSEATPELREHIAYLIHTAA